MTTFTEDTAAQRKAKKKLRTELDREENQRKEVVRKLLSSPDGRSYLWWLLTIAGVPGQTAFRKTDRETTFMCGQQNVGLQIMAHIIDCHPEGFAELMKEKVYHDRNTTVTGNTGNISEFDGDDSDDAGSPDRGTEESGGSYL